MVTDEVWRKLDPGAGRLSRRTTVRMWVAFAVALALAAAFTVAWRSGLLVARLVWSDEAGFEYSVPVGGPVRHEVVVRNVGVVDVQVVGAGRSGPGLELIGVEGTFPTTIHSGDMMSFMLTYRLTDCAAVSDQPWPVPVRVQRWWGEQTVYIALPTTFGPNARGGVVRNLGDHDPPNVEWQRNLANEAC